MNRIGSAGNYLARSSKQKIRQSQTGCRTVELELVSADVWSQIALPPMSQANSERHLMASTNHAHIIVHAVHCGDVPVTGQEATGQIKTANDRVHNGPGDFRRAVDLDAGVTPIEQLARRYVGVPIGSTVDGQTKRLNHVAADEIGRTERIGARQAAPVARVL